LIWCFGALAIAMYGSYAMEFVVFNEVAQGLAAPLAGALLASGLACAVLGRWFWRRLQGFTGDCLGTTQQVCEIAFYLGLALAL